MASLKLRLESFEDRDSPFIRHRSLISFMISKLGHESYAYKTVGTTGYCDTKVFRTLEDFLQPDSKRSLESAVQSILALIPENASQLNEVGSAGEVFLEIAEQIPYHHPSQIKLARLVEQISRSAKLTGASDPWGMRLRFFRSLRDWYTGPGEDEPEAWANINAFFANEMASHIRPHDPLFAIWTMRAAFENRSDDEKYPFDGMQEQRIIAAAQHILWGGQDLFKHVICPKELDESDLRCWEPGPPYEGDATFSWGRWRFWRRGFEAAAGNTGGFGDECRNVAERAATLMEAFGRSMLL